MKKHLIAAAVAGAFAVPAMAQVTVYGTVDVGYYDDTAKDSATGNTVDIVRTGGNAGTSGAMTSNRLGFRGEEDLGGGMKAGFVYELGNDYANTGALSTTTSRQSFLSLSGGFGTVTIGRQYSLVFSVGGAFDAGSANNLPYGRSVYGRHSALYSLGVTGDSIVRVNNAVIYVSPAISGLTVSALVAKTSSETNGVQAAIDTRVAASQDDMGFRVAYAAGPLAVQFGYHANDADSNTAASKREAVNMVAGASYDLGVAKLMVLWNDRKTEIGGTQANANSGWQVGAQVPLGAASVFVTLGEAKQEAAASRDVDVKAYQLGASYRLSKRTNAYIAYGDEEWKRVAGTKVEGQVTAIGLRHSF